MGVRAKNLDKIETGDWYSIPETARLLEVTRWTVRNSYIPKIDDQYILDTNKWGKFRKLLIRGKWLQSLFS